MSGFALALQGSIFEAQVGHVWLTTREPQGMGLEVTT